MFHISLINTRKMYIHIQCKVTFGLKNRFYNIVHVFGFLFFCRGG